MIKGKSPEEIRKTFNIKNDFTPAEEEQVSSSWLGCIVASVIAHSLMGCWLWCCGFSCKGSVMIKSYGLKIIVINLIWNLEITVMIHLTLKLTWLLMQHSNWNKNNVDSNVYFGIFIFLFVGTKGEWVVRGEVDHKVTICDNSAFLSERNYMSVYKGRIKYPRLFNVYPTVSADHHDGI